jgi:uncharacterized membrane protein
MSAYAFSLRTQEGSVTHPLYSTYILMLVLVRLLLMILLFCGNDLMTEDQALHGYTCSNAVSCKLLSPFCC